MMSALSRAAMMLSAACSELVVLVSILISGFSGRS
jgi:hypothetical protein